MPDETPNHSTPSTPTSTQEANFPASSDAEIANLLSYEAPPTVPSGVKKEETPAQNPSASTPASVEQKPTEVKSSEDESPLDRIAKRQPRKFDGLDEKEQKLFSQMSNEAYNDIYPKWIKMKELGDLDKLSSEREQSKKQLEELSKSRFYDHPEAYTLAQDYREISTIASTINQHVQFYEHQLGLAEEGKPIRMITRDAKGNFVAGPEQPVTPQLKAQLQSTLTRLAIDSRDAAAELEKIKSSYTNSFKDYEKGLDATFTNLFGKHADKLKDNAEKQLKTFPPHLQHRKEGQLLAYAMAAMRHVLDFKQQEAQAAHVNKLQKEVSSSAGPTSDSITQPAGVRPSTNVDSEYKQFMHKYA